MSRLWRSSYRVVIAPHAVALIDRRGRDRRLWSSTSDAASAVWKPSMAMLEQHLPRHARVSIVLANHWCHFASFDMPQGISEPHETLAYARNRLSAVYGEAVKAWEITVNPMAGGAALVCAAPSELIADIHNAVRARSAVVASIRPHFAVASERIRQLQDGCLAVCEPRRATLGFVAHGRWKHVIARRCGNTIDELLDVIDRERELMAGSSCAPVVWIHGAAHDMPAEHRGYQLKMTRPIATEAGHERERQVYAMAA